MLLSKEKYWYLLDKTKGKMRLSSDYSSLLRMPMAEEKILNYERITLISRWWDWEWGKLCFLYWSIAGIPSDKKSQAETNDWEFSSCYWLDIQSSCWENGRTWLHRDWPVEWNKSRRLSSWAQLRDYPADIQPFPLSCKTSQYLTHQLDPGWPHSCYYFHYSWLNDLLVLGL